MLMKGAPGVNGKMYLPVAHGPNELVDGPTHTASYEEL